MRLDIVSLVFCVLSLVAIQPASAVTMSWSPVGDPGNAADPLTGFGAVDHAYNIGTYHVTNAQYIEFLNAVDPNGQNTLGLYNPDMATVLFGGIKFDSNGALGSKYSVMPPIGVFHFDVYPVNYVTWYSAVRFANWLNNGQGSASTETGAYTLLGGTPTPSNAETIARNPGAKVFLPSEDEWYKAAYYDPATNSYFLYPTSSNTPPISSAATSAPNHANFNRPNATPSAVGAYSGTTSPVGAYDMAGNVGQWNEALFQNGAPGTFGRGWRGGYFASPAEDLLSTSRFADGPTARRYDGFRVASVPEPGSCALAIIACGLMCLFHRRFKSALR